MTPKARGSECASRLLLPILDTVIERARQIDSEGKTPTLVEPSLRRGPHRLEVVEVRQTDWRTLLALLSRDRDFWDQLLKAADAVRNDEPVETAIGWGADDSMRSQALWRDVITPLVQRYRDEREDWGWDREQCTEVLESWRASRGGEPKRRACLAPLYNCRSMEDQVAIETGLSIRRLTDSERNDLWRSHGAERHPGALNPTIADLESWDLVIDYRWTPYTSRYLDDRRAITVLVDAIRALRLHHPGLTGTSIFWLVDDPSERWRRDIGGALFAPDSVSGRSRSDGQLETHLGHSSAADLRRLLAGLRSIEGDRRLALILERFDSAYSRHSPEDRLIDLWIALEALILSDGSSELRYRAALRLAQLVGEDSEAKTQAFDLARRSYDCRSRVVHGSSIPADLGRVVEETRILAQTALRKWVLDPPKEGVATLDRANFGIAPKPVAEEVAQGPPSAVTAGTPPAEID